MRLCGTTVDVDSFVTVRPVRIMAPDSLVGRAPDLRDTGGLGSNPGLIGHFCPHPVTVSLNNFV